MESTHNSIKMTAAEISYLWTTYLSDTMSICVLQYFLQQIDDSDIKVLVQQALDLSFQHVEGIKEIYAQEGIAVPQGFTDQDVNLKAERLFSDIFYLKYIKNMAGGGLSGYSRMLPNIYRKDIKRFYSKALTSSMELEQEATLLLLEKGLATRPPFIPYPDKVEFIKKQSFFLEGLGRRGALSGKEVTHLHFNIETNQLGAAISTGFSQTAQNKQARNYFIRGKEIALKHIKVFRDYLEKHSLPAHAGIEQEVSESTQSVFSDKLMMFHFSVMIYAGIGNYGVAISESQRSDLVIDYSRLNAEILKYSEDGINIMVANEWLEQPPLSVDRQNLSKK
ncbi:DUF3231 family protein [Mesobacillus selenatarsenatis]|uniref:DUF3231 family protein n=1 Tax=Mesobacillus selenatarsenatis (strain DSM 18680 / JCM 14380 / FERM P-15431 / SF-1) TaxID=1321606 RepID=A0A0A8X394_MESS1|nr:DUF3231 family protein [Mesobacillus selenatarsenatis]GAM13497.1 hypothetical protein SAMD00020551_1642 [Mesobacillus selenatarsenatis SF-1]